MIALNTEIKEQDGKLKDKQIRYLHDDALNSVDMVTDGYGVIVERRSYDTWGKQRKVTWREESPMDVVQAVLTNRGYTGHEEIKEVGLIHMNGRVYDQDIGRFISADPVIQAPFVTNSFNRYAYMWNNPVKLIDPKGFTALAAHSYESQNFYGFSGQMSYQSGVMKNIDMSNDLRIIDLNPMDNMDISGGLGAAYTTSIHSILNFER